MPLFDLFEVSPPSFDTGALNGVMSRSLHTNVNMAWPRFEPGFPI
jgi:hypothetical protein